MAIPLYTVIVKYLGIDFGSVNVGLAVSDEAGDFVYPLSVIKNTDHLVDLVAEVCQKEKIESIVMGESKNYQMEENEIMVEARSFAKKLSEKSGLSVKLHPEFLTSAEAERLQGKNDMIDASAAAIILQSYLKQQENL